MTVCGTDNATGGLNLATALAAGGDIVIHCPAGQQTIVLTQTRNVQGVVHVDGENKVTLSGPIAGPLFTADISLKLSRLIILNPRTNVTASAVNAGTIVLAPAASVELDSVVTRDSQAAYVAKRLIVRDSMFQNNGDATVPDTPMAVLNADDIELHNATFNGNFDHPIAGGSGPNTSRPALLRRIIIEDSIFSNNRAGLLLSDAHVTIRRTRFEGNGIAPAGWARAWNCCGGAVTLVRTDTEIWETDFRSNGTSGFGGAIYAVGSRLRIRLSLFEENKARMGGAIMFWGRPPRINIWSGSDWKGPIRLELARTEFRANSAAILGGALAFAGVVRSDTTLFRANISGGAGGAIASWHAADLQDPYSDVLTALVDATLPGETDGIELARPIIVDNRAGGAGAALAVGNASAVIGNGLIARNQDTDPTGGAISGLDVSLVNSTIADNGSYGLVVATGGKARLGNTIMLRNSGFNCMVGGQISDAGGNFQYPGSDCGASVNARDPGLDAQYAPGLISAARGAADIGMCAAAPQVAGVDLFGKPRLQHGRCDSGAIEQPLLETVTSALGQGSDSNAPPKLIWLILGLILLFFMLGLLWGARRRRRKQVAGAKGGSTRPGHPASAE